MTWPGFTRRPGDVTHGPTREFLIANAVLVATAFVLATGGWSRPTLSLVIPSATLVNAIFFHVLPTVVQRRVAPGLFTAVFLYVPFSSWALVGAWRDGVPRAAIAWALVAGTVMMLTVVLAARMLGAGQTGALSTVFDRP